MAAVRAGARRRHRQAQPADSHTDFVFAVAAEEFGIILCLALLALFAFVVYPALSRAYATEDMFSRFAASGLAACSAYRLRSHVVICS